jgi:hypothetical protein
VKAAVAFLGTDPRVLEIGLRAVQHNVPIAGIWSADHDEALVASLRLGCCAFPDAQEPLRSAGWVVHSELSPVPVSGNVRCLDVHRLQLDGCTLRGHGISLEWLSWLSAIGFNIASEG